MQQGIPTGVVTEYDSTVTIGDLTISTDRVEVNTGMRDPYDRVGLASATATISGTIGEDVLNNPPTPWDLGTSWPPAPETPASVDIDAGLGPVRSITGRVSDTAGGAEAREVVAGIADLYETLDREISWGVLSDTMPHPDEAAPNRFPGLNAEALVDEILRHCGWYATPPQVGYTVLSVPAMGTMWPETGVLEACDSYQHPEGGWFPFFNSTSWGLGVSRVDAEYSMTSYTIADRGHFEMMVLTDDLTGDPDRDSMYFRVGNTAGHRFSIAWTDTVVNVWAADSAGVPVLAATAPRVPGLLYLKVDRVTSSSVKVELSVNGVSRAVNTLAIHPSLISAPLTRAEIRGDLLGGGFQAAFPVGTAGMLDDWEPTATIHRGSTAQQLKIRRDVQGGNCADMLEDYCAARGAVYWIDELGVLQWWDLQYLEAQPGVATIPASRILDGGISWTNDRSSVRSRVVVKWTDWALSSSIRSKVDLWQGRGSTFSPGDSVQEFIRTPDEEIWVLPDLRFSRVNDGAGGGGSIWEFNLGSRSWWSGVMQDSDTWASPGNGSLAMAAERITDSVFKYIISWTGTGEVETKTPTLEATTAVSKNKRSMDTPILRGKAKYALTGREYVAAQRGPATAPELVIDGGLWIQSAAQAKRVADYVAARVTVKQPRLSAVQIALTPGIQIGDVVTIVDDEASRLTVRGIVVEDSRILRSDDAPRHSLTVRPLEASRNGVTWEDWGTFMNGARFQTWGASQAGKTWGQWGQDPLT